MMKVAAIALMVAAMMPFAARAQAVPDAGRLMKEAEPGRTPGPSRSTRERQPEEPKDAAEPDATAAKVLVKGFKFKGNSALTEAELTALLHDLVGKELTLAQLRAAALRVTRHYVSKGLFITRAYLPAQEIADGIVELTVVEGRVGKVRLQNKAPVADSVIKGMLSEIREDGIVYELKLERTLLLLKSLPGVAVQSTLTPGSSTGAADLEIEVTAKDRVEGNIALDNFGSQSTGTLRLSTQLTVNNPFEMGDYLAMKVLTSGSDFKYGRVSYQLPVGDDGWQLGAAVSHLDYRLGGSFSALKAHGNADVSSVFAGYPIVRSRAANVYFQLSAESKTISDRQDATRVFIDKEVRGYSLTLSGDQMDGYGGGGLTQWSGSYANGRLALDSESAADDATSLRKAGRYDKANLSVTRLQQLPFAGDAWSLLASVSGQVAGKNLDSSEKLSLGGPLAVRAYPSGEGSVDDGWVARIDLRYDISQDWQIAGFFDSASGRIDHRSASASGNKTSLSGVGMTLSFRRPGDILVDTTVAWRAGTVPVTEADRSPRFWLTAQKNF